VIFCLLGLVLKLLVVGDNTTGAKLMLTKIPDSCKECRFVTETRRNGGEHSRCTRLDLYLSTIFGKYGDGSNFKGTKKPCPYTQTLVQIKDTWLWLRMYKKGIEKEEIQIADKEKALVRANWLVMRIAYVADWAIKKYDERMAKRRLAYNIRQAVDRFVT
jgi:hypothetical protein